MTWVPESRTPPADRWVASAAGLAFIGNNPDLGAAGPAGLVNEGGNEPNSDPTPPGPLNYVQGVEEHRRLPYPYPRGADSIGDQIAYHLAEPGLLESRILRSRNGASGFQCLCRATAPPASTRFCGA